MNFKDKKLIGLILLAFLPLIAIFTLRESIPQDQYYHQFIDVHFLFGISNFHNVLSNLPFVIIAFMGLRDYRLNKKSYNLSWIVFFIGVLLVAPGSAYYHLSPNDQTLVWDRIPMTFGFMGLISAIFTDVFNIKQEKPFLLALLILGVYSVIYWIQYNDLRLYTWLQATTILLMFYMAVVYKKAHLSMPHLVGSVGFYILAKVCESHDREIFEALGYSGHSIKHLLAAMAIYILVKMKKEYVHHEN